MMDTGSAAPAAPPLGLLRRPHAVFHPRNPRRYLHDHYRFTPGVIPALLAKPESHSP